MVNASLHSPRQWSRGGSPDCKKGRKKRTGTNKLSPLTLMQTFNVGNTNSSGRAGIPGAIGCPRNKFRKRDLVEVIRKIGPSNTSFSRVELGEGNAGSGSKEKADKLTRGRLGAQKESMIHVMEAGVLTTSQRFNELRLKADRKTFELRKLLDVLATFKLDDDALERMKLCQDPESNRIVTMIRKAENTRSEIHGKLNYRQVLRHMLQRLERNKVKFHAHLNNMEESLFSARREKEEIESLTHQLETGRSKAALELQETQRFVDVEGRERNRLMENKEQEARTARRMEAWRQQREATRVRIAQSMKGDLDSQQEAYLIHLIEEKERSINEIRARNEIRQRQVAEMECVFERIRQATGVKSLEDVVLKLANQNVNHSILEKEKFEAESKLARAKAARQSKDERFSYLKASGVGNTELNREISDKLNKEIQEFRVEVKMKKLMHERLQIILAGVKQGAVSLWQRLQPYSFLLEEAEGAHLQGLKDETDVEVQRDTVKALAVSETLLTMMLETVSGANDPRSVRFAGAGSGGGAGGETGGNTLGDTEDSSDVGSTGYVAESIAGNSSTGDVLSMRNNIRVRSAAQRDGMDIRLDEGVIDASWFQASASAYGEGFGGESASQVNIESDDKHAVEDMVPSRAFVKLCSSRQYTETIRKMEADERTKKLAEKIEMADEKEKATLTSKLARKRQQDLAMERMSTTPAIIGLPEGIHQRDDAHIKAEAFLTHVPDLE